MSDPQKEIIPVNKIKEFCRNNPSISKLSLFGSVLSDSFNENSDIDFLVEFEPGKTPSLFMLIDLEDELSTIIHRKADLRTPEELSHYFRDEVMSTAQSLYVKS